jgi:hypothetical protein
MDHKDVVRLNTAEKYVLGELSPELRDEFEDHYFDCRECAADVQALTTFMTASRQILAEQPTKAPAQPPSAKEERQGWFRWLRPAISIPAIAALAAALIFQAAVTIPHLKEQIGKQQTAQVYESSYHLQGVTRGDITSKISVKPYESFALDFDFTPSQSFPSYTGTLQDAAGQTVLQFNVNAASANKELHLVVPGDRIRPGTYQLIFTGENGNSNPEQKGTEVTRLTFVVEFQPN